MTTIFYILLGFLVLILYAVGFWFSVIYTRVAASRSVHISFEWHLAWPLTLPIHFIWCWLRIGNTAEGIGNLIQDAAANVERWLQQKLIDRDNVPSNERREEIDPWIKN